MNASLKHIIATLILTSFLALAFLSFAPMMHGADGRTQGGCPFSPMGVPLCPDNMLAVALHHVALYHSFFNVLVSWSVTMIILLLIVGANILSPTDASPPPSRAIRVYSKGIPSFVVGRKMLRRLALFEHSPSLY